MSLMELDHWLQVKLTNLKEEVKKRQDSIKELMKQEQVCKIFTKF